MTIIIFLSVLLGSMIIGMPIAFALLMSGLALMFHLDLFDSQILAQNLVNGANSFPLLAVPFFLLAGEVMNTGGLSRRIVNLAMTLIGHVRGGLGYVAIIAAVILASLSGSAIADTAALAAVLLPMMRQAGYEENRCCGLIAAGGIIAPIIPPSIGFILFGVVGNVSITKLFMAGIFPGILMATSLFVMWWFLTRNESLPVKERPTIGTIFRAVIDSFWALMLPIIIIGGLRFGIFTPTEAGVVAAVYSLFVSLCIYRSISWQGLKNSFINAAKTTGIVMFLVSAAMVVSWLITVAELPDMLIDIVSPFLEHTTLLLFMILALVLVIGMAMDFVPIIMILTPVLMPIIKAAGIDEVYFGVLFLLATSIGLITPPVGTVLNTVAGVAKLKMDGVVVGILPFITALLVLLIALIVFPSLVLAPLGWLT